MFIDRNIKSAILLIAIVSLSACNVRHADSNMNIYRADEMGIIGIKKVFKIGAHHVIPDTIFIDNGEKSPVRYIDLYAFADRKELKTIQLPQTLEGIGNDAFQGCKNLESIHIPANVHYLDANAFHRAGLRRITVDENNKHFDSRNDCNCIIEKSTGKVVLGSSSSVIPDDAPIVGEDAFYGRSSLRTICIPRAVQTIESSAFSWCRNLRNVTFELDSHGDSNLREIAQNAFGGCRIKDIELPLGLRMIGGCAFYECHNLKKIYIPQYVDSIGRAVFADCTDLESIKVDPRNIRYDSRDDCNAIIDRKYEMLIMGCKNTVIPSGVRFIDVEAFSGISGLMKLIVPEGVEEIFSDAIYYCENLKCIELPSTLKGFYGIEGCNKLRDIIIHSNVPPELAFNYGVLENVTIHVPKGCVKKYMEEYKDIMPIKKIVEIE